MKSSSSRLLGQPLDRAATTVMILVALVIVAMLSLGSQTLPRVRSFSWQDRPVSTDDVAFLLTFNQPMEPRSVEENLRIEPALSGKVSWAGRRMAYTLDLPAPYGETYELVLSKAQALSRQEGFEPFISKFKSRDRVFAYIGAEGDESGRLILFNLTKKEKTLLTPEDQLVLDFQPYPGRDRILFSAVSAKADIDRAAAAQLYSVTTGIGADLPRPGALPGQSSIIPKWQFWRRQANPEAGKTKLILDNQDYQNLNFDLSPDGKTIVVQRVKQNDPADFGQWVLQVGQSARKLDTEPGGDFKIAPDSKSLLLQQGEGTAILSLDPEDVSRKEPTRQTAQNDNTLIDFLPDYGLTLDIANDGSSAALVNFNQDDPDKRFTQTLFLVTNRGEEKPLLDTDGTIISAQFNENNTLLYSLITQVVQEETSERSDPESELGPLENGEGNYENSYEDSYQTSAFLAAINVETGEAQKLIELPPQSQIEIDLAPDGLAILFDETLAEDDEISDSGTSQYDGPSHRLWLLPLFSTLEERRNGKPVSLPPTPLDIAGRHPLWLP
ncbi:hypothetical protein S7335_2808 [Synechococcus sp. PCC 7335]|uniref:hypothetical protein n=1 Tax=Synechococcus sp. (strain ATCC 29403 / PCC 7335) TaxID=91464 RepID=UPI00017EB83D|nr:hypothetical protein [Synechococcus sp. PCC 7335]EDX85109.1 hypothetical protein S7335_2808 [Synechococcus sp. PCC 7335]